MFSVMQILNLFALSVLLFKLIYYPVTVSCEPVALNSSGFESTASFKAEKSI